MSRLEDPNQDPNRRHSDNLLIALSQRFTDFIERYDRDVGATNERYNHDQRESKEWRLAIEARLDSQDKTLAEITPAYKKGIWVIGFIAAGTLAFLVKAFWDHVGWRG